MPVPAHVARSPRAVARLGAACLAVALFVCAAPTPASADEETYVVQDRLYRMRHEISVATGVLPLDAFYKGITIGGGYTIHWSDLFAWEVARFAYAFHVNTDLREELRTNFGVEPTAFDRIRYYLFTNFVFKPLYGKWSLLNRTIVRDETPGTGASHAG